MYFVNIVLAATCCAIINFVFINGQRYGALRDDNSEEDVPSADHHTFVALIDIMFTDGSKRTCTGTIIHDNVIITAAHCFYSEKNKKARAELTASFVVIGTKHSFETGYEQYLPIERVVTHPKYKDWTADLALVYTFAGMTSDKPGTVIPLAGESSSTHVDSNVTVISWGHLKEDDIDTHRGVTKVKMISKKSCSDSTSHENSDEIAENSTSGIPLRAWQSSAEDNKSPSRMIARNLEQSKLNQKLGITKKRPYISLEEELLKRKGLGQFQIDLNKYRQRAQHDITTKVHSRYLTIADEDKFAQRTEQQHYNGEKLQIKTTKAVIGNKETPVLRASRNDRSKKVLQPNRSLSPQRDEFEMYNMKSYYKNWRRQMGTQQNKLTVETFGFVNMHTCKRYLESVLPEKYHLKGTNDVICYSTEGHYITAKDSGAPAIRQGRLVAVTIGGIKYEGEHVAIGMKMNCYCSWIIDNLPMGTSYVSCCKNCCDIKLADGDKTFRLKNKYI